MPTRNVRNQRQEYYIGGINDKTKSVLTLLATTNSNNFAKRRKEIIFQHLKLEHPHSRSEAIKTCLSKVRMVIPENVEDDLIKGKITPYEAVGMIKDLNEFKTNVFKANRDRKWRKDEMRDTWTFLSIIDGLDKLDSDKIHPNIDELITSQSINPKLENLAISLDQPKPEKGKKYKENFPHLRTSMGDATNWGEILNGLNNRSSALIKNLLQASKDDIDKRKITKDFLWPTQSHEQVKNRKLSTIINKLGNRPTGRKRRYEKIIRGLEDELKLPDLPEVEDSKPNKKEVKLSKEVLKALQQTLAGSGDMDEVSEKINRNSFQTRPQMRPKKDTRYWKLHKVEAALLTGFNALLYLKGINTKEAQEGWEMFRPYYEKWKTKFSPPGTALIKIAQKDPISQSMLINTLLSKKCAEKLIVSGHETIRDSLTYKFLGGFNNIKEFKDKILSSKILSKSNVIKQALEQRMTIPKPNKQTRLWDLLDHLLEGRPLNLNKTYGQFGLTMLHITSIVGSKEEITALCDEHRKQGISLNPKSLDGYTPLHVSDEMSSKILLSKGADPNATSHSGERPENWRSKLYIYPEGQKKKDSHIKAYRFRNKMRTNSIEEEVNI